MRSEATAIVATVATMPNARRAVTTGDNDSRTRAASSERNDGMTSYPMP